MQDYKNIFLIDDDPITNIISTKIIKKSFAFNVTAFTNAAEALERLKEWSSTEGAEFPEIIFLDINMPHMDGWEFLEEFQKLPSRLLEKCGVVMLTSSIDINDIEKSKLYTSVREFISKPLTPDKLRFLILN
jgi:CheY-like chemotaxis protein